MRDVIWGLAVGLLAGAIALAIWWGKGGLVA